MSLLKEFDFFSAINPCYQLKEIYGGLNDECIHYVFVDFSIAEVDLFSFIKKTIAVCKNVYVIVVSSLENDKTIVSVRRAGAHAFVSKKSGKKEIRDCIDTIHDKQFYISPEVFNNILQLQLAEQSELITAREYEILYYMASGKKIPEIAFLLKISRFTVIKDRKNLMKKSGAGNMAELIKIAVRDGYLE